MPTSGLSGSLDGKSVIIQGLGNVGYYTGKILSEEHGARIVCVMERGGAIMNPKGLDIEALKTWLNEYGKVEGFPGGTFDPDSSSHLTDPCDILIPAALEGVINQDNAGDIQARVIIEAANGPITAGGDAILRDKGTLIIPDMYANAGGVTVSYFEWVKNLSHIRFGRMERRAEENRTNLLVSELERISSNPSVNWTLSEDFKQRYLRGDGELELVRSGLDDTMRAAYQDMAEVWRTDPRVPDLRTAAISSAIRKIAASYVAKGL